MENQIIQQLGQTLQRLLPEVQRQVKSLKDFAIFRPKKGQKTAIAKAKKFAKSKVPYDFGFSRGTSAMYCFELYDGIAGLQIETEGYDCVENVCFGLDPIRYMKDSETLGEFKEKIVKMLNAAGLKAEKSKVDFVTGGSDASGMAFFGSCG